MALCLANGWCHYDNVALRFRVIDTFLRLQRVLLEGVSPADSCASLSGLPPVVGVFPSPTAAPPPHRRQLGCTVQPLAGSGVNTALRDGSGVVPLGEVGRQLRGPPSSATPRADRARADVSPAWSPPVIGSAGAQRYGGDCDARVPNRPG